MTKYMDNQPTTEQPNLDELEMKSPTKVPLHQSSEATPLNGLLIGGLVIALLVIMIGLYLWYQAGQTVVTSIHVPSRPTAEMNNEPESTTAEAQVEGFAAMSNSDELSTIEADLESTNLEALESELLQIDTELQAEF